MLRVVGRYGEADFDACLKSAIGCQHHECRRLERVVWGHDDSPMIYASLEIATRVTRGLLIGCKTEGQQGFAFGTPQIPSQEVHGLRSAIQRCFPAEDKVLEQAQSTKSSLGRLHVATNKT